MNMPCSEDCAWCVRMTAKATKIIIIVLDYNSADILAGKQVFTVTKTIVNILL